jgi:hypothetical protein
MLPPGLMGFSSEDDQSDRFFFCSRVTLADSTPVERASLHPNVWAGISKIGVWLKNWHKRCCIPFVARQGGSTEMPPGLMGFPRRMISRTASCVNRESLGRSENSSCQMPRRQQHLSQPCFRESLVHLRLLQLRRELRQIPGDHTR